MGVEGGTVEDNHVRAQTTRGSDLVKVASVCSLESESIVNVPEGDGHAFTRC